MAGERYIDKAVVKLAAYLSANLPAKLRAVETAQSMTANSLTDPVEVLDHRAPYDNRSPLVECFDESWDFVDLPNKMVSVDCTIALSYLGDANLANGEKFMRRYSTALIECLLADATLGGEVVAAIPTDGSSASARGDSSQTRFIYTQGVDVRLHEGGS